MSGAPVAAAAASFSRSRVEDPLPAVTGIGGDVDGNREPRHPAVERGAEEAHGSDPDDLVVVHDQRHDPLAGGVPLEPPGRALLVRELCRPDPREEGDERGASVH